MTCKSEPGTISWTENPSGCRPSRGQIGFPYADPEGKADEQGKSKENSLEKTS